MSQLNNSGEVGVEEELSNLASSYSDRFENLLNSRFRSDFTLILGQEGVEVPVHKIFLQSASQVLDAAVKSSQNNELILDHVNPAMFKMLLQHLYTGRSGVGMESFIPLYDLATKYQIPALVNECVTFYMGRDKDDTILPMFEWAMKIGHISRSQDCLKFICRKGCKILKREEFANLPLSCLLEILQQDELRAKNEIAVFEALFRWGQAECERQGVDAKDPKELRKILTKPLKHIRFPLMNKEDFALAVATKNILTYDEITTLLTHFLISPERRSVLPPGKFSSNPRSYCSTIGPESDADGCDCPSTSPPTTPIPDKLDPFYEKGTIPEPVSMHRYYNPARGDHFYTTDYSEMEGGRHGWSYEGVGFRVHSTQVPGTVAFHRYWSMTDRDHSYTTRLHEMTGSHCDYQYEGVAGYIYEEPVPGCKTLYHYYNTMDKDNYFTTDWNEMGYGPVGDWVLEREAGYVF